MFRTVRKKIFRLAFVSGVGAAAAYFFDKEKGEERRAEVKEKANDLIGKPTAGGSWQTQTERSANGFEPTVVPTSPAPAPPVSDVIVPPAPTPIVTDNAPGATATPAAPHSGV